MTRITLEYIRAALDIPAEEMRAALLAMAPEGRPMTPPPGVEARQAGVLVLLFPDEDDLLHLMLTRRTAHLRGHSGQISFPGGRRDPSDASFIETALRETCEELGLCAADQIEILGSLTRFYIPPSNYEVHPVVAWLPGLPELRPNADEVAEVFSMPLADLLRPEIKHVEDWTFDGQTRRIAFYMVQGHKVWGATAAMLSEFEHRLRRVLPAPLIASLRTQ